MVLFGPVSYPSFARLTVSRLLLIWFAILPALGVAQPVDPTTLVRVAEIDRWTSTALGMGGLAQGDPTTLTWNVVPDGTPIVPRDAEESSDPSNLIGTLDQVYGAPDAWRMPFARVFQRWSSLSGLTYLWEPNDDGSAIQTLDPQAGVIGVRADIRIGGHAIDGDGGVAGYGYGPGRGDIVLDTSDSFIKTPGEDARLHRNLLAHEHGHGLGLDHVISSDSAFLMEPFLASFIDGPQLDDILLLQRGYGDAYERNGGNDQPQLATDLGVLSADREIGVGRDGSSLEVLPDQSDFVSIDGIADVDYYKFDAPGRGFVWLTLQPEGAVYQQGAEDRPQMRLDSSALNDLKLELLSNGGVGALAVADQSTFGQRELISEFFLTEPGGYIVRVSGRLDLPQLYSLTLHFSTSSVFAGDINGDSQLTIVDIDLFALRLRQGVNDSLFDLDGSGQVGFEDFEFLINSEFATFFGDANLDGAFNSDDLIQVFQSGLYEDLIPNNATWATGDWNADGDFTSDDLLQAFADGGYDLAAKTAALAAVPEPGSLPTMLLAVVLLWARRKPPGSTPAAAVGVSV